jgi:hypothetical protein
MELANLENVAISCVTADLDISIILSFQSKEIRDKFYNNFKDLIEIAKEFI